MKNVTPTPPPGASDNPELPLAVLPEPELSGPRALPRRALRPGSLLTLATVWVVIIVVVWFVLHPLFNIAFPLYPSEITGRIAGALGSLLLDVGLLLACSVGSTALGLTMLGWCGFRADATGLAGAERLLFGVGVGLGLNIGLVLGLGVLGGINWPVAYGLLVVELGLGLWQWPSYRPLLKEAGPNLSKWWREAGWLEKSLVVWLGLVALATLLLALAPPLAWDALMYHLAGPRQYLAAGRVEYLPRLGQASFPFGAEMLFTWGLLLHGDGLAQAFSWLFGVLGAGACLVLARRWMAPALGSGPARQAGLLAAALYVSGQHVWLLMTWAYTDLLIAFYGLLAVLALLVALEKLATGGALRYSALAGGMAGLACSGKYTAVAVGAGAGAGALVYAFLGQVRPRLRQILTQGGIFALFAALAFAPWLVRNLLGAGNPFAPLFGGIRGWPQEEIAALTSQDGGVPLSPAVVLGRPFQLVLTGRDGGSFDATLSPLFLAFAPLAIWAAGRSRLVAALWAAVGVNYLGWLVGIRLSGGADHSRLLVAAFPLLALATAYALVDFWRLGLVGRQARLLRGLARLVVAGFLAASLVSLTLFWVANDPLPFHTGLQTRDERLEAQLGDYYRAARFVNQQLPSEAKLTMFLEPRGYYFQHLLSEDHNSGGQFFFYLTRYGTPEAVWRELRGRGSTHILVNDKLLNFLRETVEYKAQDKAVAGRLLLDEMERQGFAEKLYQEAGAYTVYKLR